MTNGKPLFFDQPSTTARHLPMNPHHPPPPNLQHPSLSDAPHPHGHAPGQNQLFINPHYHTPYSGPPVQGVPFTGAPFYPPPQLGRSLSIPGGHGGSFYSSSSAPPHGGMTRKRGHQRQFKLPRSSLLADVRVTRNMWTHTEYRGFQKEQQDGPAENRVTWGFTYMGRRHFIEFIHGGKYGEIHSISVDDRVIEKIETDQNMGWGPASYRIYCAGKIKTSQNPTKSSSRLKFPCVISVARDKFSSRKYHLSIDGISFETARTNFITKYLRSVYDATNGVSKQWKPEEFEASSSVTSEGTQDEERCKMWKFVYKNHTHEVKFHHHLHSCQWDITLDGKQAELYKMDEQVEIPDKSIQNTSNRGVNIKFLVHGLPCSVSVHKKNFFYFYELIIDNVPFQVYYDLAHPKSDQ